MKSVRAWREERESVQHCNARTPSLFHATTLLLVCLLSGCSRYVPVEGIVTLDGKPLPGASIAFTPADKEGIRGGPRQATCVADGEGRFQMKTQRYAGMVPGRYKVKVSKKVLPAGVREPTNARENVAVASLLKEVVPAAYTKDRDTPLVVEIPGGGKKDIDLQLRGAAEPARK